MLTIYLVRHGETELNKEYRFIGTTDATLSDEGEEQAREVRKQMSNIPLSAIYSSNLLRAAQTAEIIAVSRNIEIQVKHDLREIDFGRWEGLTYYEIIEFD